MKKTFLRVCLLGFLLGGFPLTTFGEEAVSVLYNVNGDTVSYGNGLVCFNSSCRYAITGGKLAVRTYPLGTVVFIYSDSSILPSYPYLYSYEHFSSEFNSCMGARDLQYAFTSTGAYMYEPLSSGYQTFVPIPEAGCPIIGGYDGNLIENPGLFFSSTIPSTSDWFPSLSLQPQLQQT